MYDRNTQPVRDHSSLILFHPLTRHAVDYGVSSGIHEPHAQPDAEHDQGEQDRREGDDCKRHMEIGTIIVCQIQRWQLQQYSRLGSPTSGTTSRTDPVITIRLPAYAQNTRPACESGDRHND